MELLTERYAQQIVGVLSCFDRVQVCGTLQHVGYEQGMTSFLISKHVRLVDYPAWAARLRDELKHNAEQLAHENDLTIEYLLHSQERKEALVQERLQQRADQPGLVCIFSALEKGGVFEYHRDKHSGCVSLRYRQTKCLHYYFYLLHPELGLCYLRVSTWAPFRLQFYFNAHNWLAIRLAQEGIAYHQIDNTFVQIADFERAQALADAFPVAWLHEQLDQLARIYCPVLKHFPAPYQWSLTQLEYATDIVFRRQEDLRPLYETLVHTAIHTVRPADIATFLGRKLHGRYQDEVGNRFNTRLLGTRIKHQMGPVSIKMYDKLALVLRIETTVNDLTFFKHHRKVEHHDGTWEFKDAPMKKSLYSLSPLRPLLQAANRRYLEFLSQLADPTVGLKKVQAIAEPVRYNDRTYRGFNLFDAQELLLFRSIAAGEFTISGFTNAALRRLLPERSSSQLSRLLKRLRLHGLIRKIGHSYKYYLTQLGREVVLTALKLRELVVIPQLALSVAAHAKS